MGKVAASLESRTPAGRATFDQLGMDPARGAARARLEVEEALSSAELATLGAAFSTVPAWRDEPDVLRKAVRGAVSKRGTRQLKAVTDCDPGPGTPLGITDYYIAAGVALGLEAVHEAIPDDILTSPAQIVAATTSGVSPRVRR